MFCRKCHYALDKLAEHRCPECGTAFDPKHRSSYRIQREIELIGEDRFIVVSLLGVAACATAAGVLYAVLF